MLSVAREPMTDELMSLDDQTPAQPRTTQFWAANSDNTYSVYRNLASSSEGALILPFRLASFLETHVPTATSCGPASRARAAQQGKLAVFGSIVNLSGMRVHLSHVSVCRYI